MQVMKPRTQKGPAWTNDESASTPVAIPVDASSLPQNDTIMAEEEWGGITTEKPNTEMTDMEWLRQRVSNTVDTMKVFDQSDEMDLSAPGLPKLTVSSAIIASTLV